MISREGKRNRHGTDSEGRRTGEGDDDGSRGRQEAAGAAGNRLWEREDPPKSALVLTQGGLEMGALVPATAWKPLRDRVQHPN